MRRALLFLGLLCHWVGVTMVWGAVRGSFTADNDGKFTYSYTVDNAVGSFDIFAWSLQFQLDPGQIDWNQNSVANGGEVVAPLGSAPDFFDAWTARVGVPANDVQGLSAQDFEALDLLGAGDVLVGEVLGGFSFRSQHPPHKTVFSIEFGPLGDRVVGETVGPGITPNAQNTPPTITVIGNKTVSEDKVLGPVGFSIDDAENPAEFLEVAAVSSDQGILPDGNIVLEGAGADRTVTITPVVGQRGVVTVSLTVTDGDGGVAQAMFEVEVKEMPRPVLRVNRPPSITAIPDQFVIGASSIGPITFSISDPESPASQLIVRARSLNQALLSDRNILFSGRDATRRITLTQVSSLVVSGEVSVTVEDPNGAKAEARFKVTAAPASSRVIDNKDPGFSVQGPWEESSSADEFQGSSLFTVDPNAVASWKAEVMASGEYLVVAWWSGLRAGGQRIPRTRNARFSITSEGVAESVTVDQSNRSGEWVPLGTFALSAGAETRITLQAGFPDGRTLSADAITLVPLSAGGNDIIVDNLDAGFSMSGSWNESGAADEFKGSSLFAAEPGARAVWAPVIQESGDYETFVWWAARSASGGRLLRGEAIYQVSHAKGEVEIQINQRTRGGGQWIALGIFPFEAGQSGFIGVEVPAGATAPVSADAARWVRRIGSTPDDLVIDNLDEGFLSVGSWEESSAIDEFQGSSLVGYSFEGEARWVPGFTEPGRYEVLAWWSGVGANGTRLGRNRNAKYVIRHAGRQDIVMVNQNRGSGSWVRLGTFGFAAGGGEWAAVQSGGALTSADAMRFLRVNP